jgi:hypothetical protein
MKPVNSILQASAPDPSYKPPPTSQWLRSSRDHQLVWSSIITLGVLPTVTVELYVKWYSLFVVRIGYDDVVLEEVPFPGDEYCEAGESYCADHAPNPTVVARWAAKHGYDVDELAMELMIGRWEREGRNNYSTTYVGPPETPEPPCTLCEGKGYDEVVGLTDPVLGQAINPCKCRLKED